MSNPIDPKRITFLISIMILLWLFQPGPLYAQQSKIVWDQVFSKALINTVTKENPTRRVAVYLPPSYLNTTKRYPVLYLLHGVGDSSTVYTEDTVKYHNIKDLMDQGIESQKFGEMIIVMPNEQTTWYGSFYTNSTVTGNWENFTADDLVSYIDNKYRTIAAVSARAIAGHSMGGYGAITLAMKHPDVFSSVYAMNAALISFRGEITPTNPGMKKFIRATNLDAIKAAKSFVTMGLLSVARAFSPNPLNAPLYIDKPFKFSGKQLVPVPLVYRKWGEKDVVKMAVKYDLNLKQLKAIKFDSGLQDDSRFIIENNRLFALALRAQHIPYEFEEYQGDHSNKLWGLDGRIYQKMLPFIFKHVTN
jgi:S-formylglutathione hydrolase FrmB